MSNPPTTIRGWLQAIFNALSGLSNIAPLVAELRYISRRLFGVDSQGESLSEAQQPPLNQVAPDLRRLAGTITPPTGWAGLPDYLARVVGNASGAGTLQGNTFNAVNRLTIIRDAVGLPQGGDGVFNELRRMRTPQEEDTGWHGGDVLEAMETLSNVRRLISTVYPPSLDTDVFQLLKDLATLGQQQLDCCEDDGGTEPGDLEEPDPLLCGLELVPFAPKMNIILNFSETGVLQGLVVRDGLLRGVDVVTPEWGNGNEFNIGAGACSCLQLARASTDTGRYFITGRTYNEEGVVTSPPLGPSMDVPPNQGTFFAFRENDNDGERVHYVFDVTRLNATLDEPEVWTGVQPRLIFTAAVCPS